jgi:hypothetical protein
MAAPADPVLSALIALGAPIRKVHYRRNRSVLLSLSRDGTTLNSHECFRDAPGPVIEAIAVFLRSPRGSARHRTALASIREWEGTRTGVERARRQRPPRRPPPGPSQELERLRSLYDRYNGTRFGSLLPPVPLRVSRRMTRSLGTIGYGERAGVRRVREIAIAADLLLAGNERLLEDTLLHEMAHAEAWLLHGHRGHGRHWRRIAARVGCVPRAISEVRVLRRRRGRRGVGAARP